MAASAIANLLGKVDANGALLVALSGGTASATTFTVDTLIFDNANPDVSLSRGAANRLDLASGDSFSIVSGGFGVGLVETTAGNVSAANNVLAGGGVQAAANDSFRFGSTSVRMRRIADGQMNLLATNAETAGVGFDFATDGILGIRTRAQTGNAQLYAASVRGVAVAFASLPGTPVEGMLVAVTDGSTATWGATLAGGGANHVLAYYNGTNWTVAGK